MRRINLLLIVLCVVFSAVAARGASIPDVNHWDLQAVDGTGTGTYYNSTGQVIIEGIILNNPEEMLDATPAYTDYYDENNMGGEWQIFIQGEGDDHAGTALWMGQNYGNLPWKHNPALSYTDEEWLAELSRINRDESTGYIFNKGDRVRVTGWYKFYGGKTNINEQHVKNDFMDFKIELLEAGAGLPHPEIITLDMLKDINDDPIFEQDRLSGCENYQGRLVRVNNVQFTAGNWGPDEIIQVEDTNGLTFDVHLGMGKGFSEPNNLAEPFDLIGILNQEDGSSPHTSGYEIWVTNYDGNGQVLTDRGFDRGNLPGDINSDYKVDLKDFAVMAEDWLNWSPGLYDDGE